MELHDRVALVTGAGRGIGRAIAVRLAREGAQVIVNDVDLHAAEETANQIGGAIPISADVADRTDVHRLIHEVITRFGRVDILVNNAGVFSSAPISRMTEVEWDRVIAVNLKSVFLCAQAAAKYMIKQKSGKIVNISSIRGIDHCGREGIMDYCASKGAVINLTKTMAKELAPYINVNTVAPGHTNTEMTKSLPEEVRRNMIEGSYLKRLAEPEDIAKAILFLASDDSDFVTGQILLVDGGFSLK